jgi:hypothetical protein
MAVPPENLTWDEFTARQVARESGEDLAGPIQPPPRQRPDKESSLSALLMQAIHAAARCGRISRAERIRQQTLLEVLSEAMRRR